VPIFDAILRDEPARHSVRPLIVYPMNALIKQPDQGPQRLPRRELARLPGSRAC
jgi:hypothetical protein